MPDVVTRTVEPDEAGMRLDRWFRVHYPELGFGHLQKLIRSGQVRVDGGRVRTNTRLAPGQSVRVPPVSRERAPIGMRLTRREGGKNEGARDSAPDPLVRAVTAS